MFAGTLRSIGTSLSIILSRPSYLQQSSCDPYEFEHYILFVDHAQEDLCDGVRLGNNEYHVIAEYFVVLADEAYLQQQFLLQYKR